MYIVLSVLLHTGLVRNAVARGLAVMKNSDRFVLLWRI